MPNNAGKTVIGQIGLGNWGQNLLRNFSALADCAVKHACDLNPARLDKFSREYPGINITADPAAVLNDKEVEAIVVATQAPYHYEVAKQALNKGKHVFVEKPITLSVKEAEELVSLAGKTGRKIMVGHLLMYHPAIVRLKALIAEGELGKVHYIYTQRLNLGTIRNTENVMWSLAPHDISIILHLIGGSPQSVSALGAAFVQKGIEDVAFLNIRFAAGEIGHVHVSWLDPTKTRRTIVVGSKKMAVFDEVSSRDTLVLIDKGVDVNPDFKNFEEFIKL
ncbi:MAG TPA: Gfo/Idh/MocA family oxidoreductase, partial [Candidatus Sulfotelmatobacter sp.]|nr:Gfo/Idh/MocA family oxidoreductase [Candidatus Sulfotelmatobacter sp.]